MKLDRNANPSGVGKYAIIKLRDVPVGYPKFTEESSGNEFLTVPSSCVDFGNTRDTEFFVIRLKDEYAAPALKAYAAACADPEFALEVHRLALIAESHPSKRKPD